MTCHPCSSKFVIALPLAACLLAAAMLSGCSVQPAALETPATVAATSGVSGKIMGGQQPISGATIQLYAVGTASDGSASTKLLTSTVTSGSNGTFTLTGLYTCPSLNPYVYLLATGGNASFGSNSSIALIAALGQCNTLSGGTYITVNEVTTAAAVMALAPYMSSPASIGSGALDASALASAFALAGEYANFTTGTSPGTGVPSGFTVPATLINSLADIIASCVNSAGPTSSACLTLFTGATPSVGSAPVDVATALLDLANNPSNSVANIFNLSTPTAPFQPTLTTAPATWNVALTPASPAPTVAAASLTFATTTPGIAAASQTVTINNPASTGTALNSITLIGPAAGAYSIAGNTCGSTLAAGGNCSVTISFAPSSNGVLDADLAVSNSASASPIYVPLSGLSSPPSQWVYSSGGNLAYKTLSNPDNSGTNGYDQIMDFSTAGYMAGGTAIPSAPVAVTLSPSGGDDTSAIQSAINSVGALSLNSTTGLRGAVLLNPGSYTVSSTLNITASGVVLRGSGSGSSPATNTVITQVAASTPYPLIVLGSSGTSPSYTSGTITTVTDSYVPAGSLKLDVSNAAVYSIGQSVMVKRPATTNWITFMNMLPSEIQPQSNCSSGTCNWISTSTSAFKTDRVITAINGNQITLDSPMSDSLDSTYLGTGAVNVQAFTFPTRISQVGVENLRAIAPVPATNLVPPTASYQLVVTYAVLNAWIRNLTSQDALQAIDVEPYGKQVTVSNVAVTHTVTQTDSAKFEDFYVNGATQVLMDSVSDITDNMYFFSTSSETQGPIVLRNGSFAGDTNIEPHQRWATGVLVENTTISAVSSSDSAGQINFWDRGDYGSGQGWAVGWGVVWNSTSSGFTIQQPPGSQNWCIGCVGGQIITSAPGGSTNLTQGAIDSSGTYVYPVSLYQAQLTQRLGPGIIAQ